MFFMVAGLLSSCNQENLISDIHSTQIEDASVGSNIESKSLTFMRGGVELLRGAVQVTCSTEQCAGGNIGPNEHCQVGQRGGEVFCSCSGCVMTITASRYSSDESVLDQLRAEGDFADNARSFVKKKHEEIITNFNSISYYFAESYTTIMFEYELSDGEIGTVMYVNEYDIQGRKDKTYEIDCTGPCGCREQYNLNTGTASCSCDDCVMTVTVTD